MSLKANAIHGVKWTALSVFISTLAQVLQMTVMAHYLTPSDFGLMAITMIVIGFSQAFMDMGISSAIIHKQEITHIQLSSLYWLNVASGIVLYGVIIVAAPIMAQIYHEPKLIELIILMGFSFVVVAVGNQYRIIYQKDLRFNLIAKIEIISVTTSTALAICLAVMNYGVYALVWGALLNAALSTVILLITGLKKYRPKFIYNHNEISSFYSFGLFQMGEKSINYLSANVDKIFIGHFLGMEALGFYNLAWQLIIFPLSKINPLVNRVAFPIYAKIQDDIFKLGYFYTFSLKSLSLLIIPLSIFLFFYSDQVVYMIYGPNWKTTADIVKILTFVGLLKALSNPAGSIILALGRADVGFWWNLFWAIFVSTVLFVVLFIYSDIMKTTYSLLASSLVAFIVFNKIIAVISKIQYKAIYQYFVKTICVALAIGYVSVKLIYSSYSLSLIGGVHMKLGAFFKADTIDNAVVLIFASVFCALMHVMYVSKFEAELITAVKNKGG
ncbi:MOP flippase family protein [Methylomicrobium lacus]|uniref:MOP flippase family protein n=1 Tax=Methylomicrobium lacus TaxID=136992 RepID=UPI0035A8CF53